MRKLAQIIPWPNRALTITPPAVWPAPAAERRATTAEITAAGLVTPAGVLQEAA